MNNPVTTYRIQFHSGFTFKDLEKILSYLQKLGIGTLYASPVFEAVPGSTHGYDGVNPNQINPEIGTEKQLRSLSKQLQKRGIGWLQDIVPNHMAFHPNNPWLMDVLEKGHLSRYVPFFDTVWTSQLFRGRLAVPFLGSPLNEVIKNRELKVAYRNGCFVLTYFDTAYPVRLRSYPTVLQAADRSIPESLQQLIDQIRPIQLVDEPEAYALALNEFQLQLTSLLKNASIRTYVNACLSAINRQPDRIQQLADEQHYQLMYHEETDRRINFRRFFTVSSLIGLNIQDDAVFRDFHRQIKVLLDDGVVTGLRIDHVDGLYDPSRYLTQLRALAGDETYLVVEKILGIDEPLPDAWPIQGTTGYEFLAQVNNLFTQPASETVFTRFYQQLVNDRSPIQRQILNKKAFILAQYMQGELDNLCRFFLELNLVDDNELAILPPNALSATISAFLVYCPVYRFYGNGFPLEDQEAQAVWNILQHIRKDKPELSLVTDLLDEIFLQKPQESDPVYNQQVARFYRRCMQFTGPLMAKGMEDTLMYTYNRFIGHNEVGDSPAAFGCVPDDFHRAMQERQSQWPLALNATATHDTKRGEDVRARLNVLTDLPELWVQNVQEWQRMNADLKKDGSPDTNDEYFIYQTLIGAWPMPGQDVSDFENRLADYLEKALREAKRHSNWSTPNADYEEDTKRFAGKLLDRKRPFFNHFQRFFRKIVDFGILNSLAQVVLKMTCPGVPDIYQGCELWDLSLVDPDNRRPVDYAQRQVWLDEITGFESTQDGTFPGDLWKNRYDARIKLWLTHTVLKERIQHPDLFAEGRYIPLAIEGRYKDYVLAFARQYRENWLLVAVPLHLAAMSEEQKKEIPVLDWKDTRIGLPPEAPHDWQHVFWQTSGSSTGYIAVKEIFKPLPMAILKLKRSVTNRSAGLLLPVTSLPSAFGIGDLGPEATAFADFLARARQKYWQILPLNPTDAGAGHSPYSTHSSMGGNSLLVSPELLLQDGLLDPSELPHYALPATSSVDYSRAEWVRNALFEKAFRTFQGQNFTVLQRQFQQFCQREAHWLDDFALYQVLKQQFNNKPWFQWPAAYRLRDPEALQSVAENTAEALEKARWLQFVFDRQWQGLKTYCNNRGIQLLGDLPFYVSYDSADVWSHPDIFSLDEAGKLVTVAGVPPDYFNDNGQLWGMPVFRWDRLRERNYDWWIRRIRKNAELFDLVRIDHFRALSEYWEVPAGEKTAIHGAWKPGPGADFFRVLKKELGTLPLVAEDLGDISEDVYQLRDAFKLPGMKVIQFAFHNDLGHSPHIPHNYTPNFIAYTGTHDNNTTRGWYRQSLNPVLRKKVAQYVGKPVSDKNVHLVLGQWVYASVAKTVILPVQDILGLDETARINTPAAVTNNWLWRLRPGQLTAEAETQLREWATLYNRW